MIMYKNNKVQRKKILNDKIFQKSLVVQSFPQKYAL